MRRAFNSSDLLLGPAIVAASVRLNTPTLGLGSLATPLRLGLQALVILVALGLTLLYPSSALAVTRHRPTRLLVGFAAFLAASALWSATPARSLAQGLTALAIVVTISGHGYYRAWHTTRAALLRGFALVLLLGSLVDLAEGAGIGRWSGLAGAPTQLAQLAVMTSALALVGWMSRQETGFFTVSVVFLGLAQILLSQSRVALGTVLVLVIVTVCISAPATIRPALASGTVAVIAMVVAAFANQALALGLRDGAEAAELTELTGRTSIWPEAIDLFETRPWLGSGFASGEAVWADRVLAGDLNWYPSNAHNLALELLVSLGLVGLGLGILAVSSSFWTQSSAAPVATKVFVAVVVVLGATESMVHFASPTFALLALAAAAAVPARAESFRIRPGSRELKRAI